MTEEELARISELVIPADLFDDDNETLYICPKQLEDYVKKISYKLEQIRPHRRANECRMGEISYYVITLEDVIIPRDYREVIGKLFEDKGWRIDSLGSKPRTLSGEKDRTMITLFPRDLPLKRKLGSNIT